MGLDVGHRGGDVGLLERELWMLTVEQASGFRSTKEAKHA
jgi:hypothetical protein